MREIIWWDKPPKYSKAHRFMESVEAVGAQTRFQLHIISPDRELKVQRQRDEGCVFWIDVATQAPGFHPRAHGDAPYFDEMKPGQQLMKAFQQSTYAPHSPGIVSRADFRPMC